MTAATDSYAFLSRRSWSNSQLERARKILDATLPILTTPYDTRHGT